MRMMMMICKTVKETETATSSCRTWKRAVHFYSPDVVRRRHAAALHVRPAAAAAAAAVALLLMLLLPPLL